MAEHLFRHGLCLPSGSSLTEGDRLRVVETLLATPKTRRAWLTPAAPLRTGTGGRSALV